MKQWKEDIDYDLIHRLVVHIVKEEKRGNASGAENGAILIFVPGWTEIRFRGTRFDEAAAVTFSMFQPGSTAVRWMNA